MTLDFIAKLSKAYWLGLLSVVALAVASQIIMVPALTNKLSDGTRINLAGKQRMLSQKLGLQAVGFSAGLTDRGLISQTLKEWFLAHEALTRGSTTAGLEPLSDPGLLARYADLEPIMRRIEHSTSTLSGDKQADAERLQNLVEDLDEFLVDMNSLVYAHELDAEGKLRSIRLYQWGLFVALMCVLALQAKWAFLPAIRGVSKELNEKVKAQEELRVAFDRAVDSERKTRTFLSSVSHDIKTPLNAISGYAALLKAEAQSEVSDAIDAAVLALNTKVSNVLDAASESIRYSAIPVEVNLRDLTNAAVAAMASELQARRVVVTVDVDAQCRGIADRTLLTRLVINLISQNMGVAQAIFFSCAASSGDGHLLKLQVQLRPQSNPAPDPMLDRIDLAIANAMDVTVHSYNTALTKYSEIKIPGPRLEAAAEPGYPASGRDMVVLVVDDNAVNRKVASAMLAQVTRFVHVVSNGLEAVQFVETEPVDFILMDVEMPVMDGIEATRQIRSLQCTQPIIVALTGNTLQETRDACDAAGMDGFISKPLRLNDVLGM